MTDVDTAGLLDGRVAIVSGVGPGLGRAIALALADAGADVGLGARGPWRPGTNGMSPDAENDSMKK